MTRRTLLLDWSLAKPVTESSKPREADDGFRVRDERVGRGSDLGWHLAAAARRLLGDRRLLIATNRGPVTFAVDRQGDLRPRRGSGGLVTALGRVGRHVPVTWIAAPMSEGDRRAATDAKLIDRALPDDEQCNTSEGYALVDGSE